MSCYRIIAGWYIYKCIFSSVIVSILRMLLIKPLCGSNHAHRCHASLPCILYIGTWLETLIPIKSTTYHVSTPNIGYMLVTRQITCTCKITTVESWGTPYITVDMIYNNNKHTSHSYTSHQSYHQHPIETFWMLWFVFLLLYGMIVDSMLEGQWRLSYGKFKHHYWVNHHTVQEQ